MIISSLNNITEIIGRILNEKTHPGPNGSSMVFRGFSPSPLYQKINLYRQRLNQAQHSMEKLELEIKSFINCALLYKI